MKMIPNVTDYCTINLKTKNKPVFQSTNIYAFFDEMSAKILKEKEDTETKDSGWTFDRLEWLEL